MRRPRVHVLFEHGADELPFGSAQIRFLLPLQHPRIAERIDASFGLSYDGRAVDGVIVDGLWRPDISPALAVDLVSCIRRAGARLIYAIDDSLLDLPGESKDWRVREEQLEVVRLFLGAADSVLVSTPALKARLASFNDHIDVMPHVLDERLLPGRERCGNTGATAEPVNLDPFLALWRKFALRRAEPMPGRPLVIGYMGTYTHDDDLLMVLPALRTVFARHPFRVQLELVGIAGRPGTVKALENLPVRRINPPEGQREYPAFLAWFSRAMQWDIAVAPLRDSPFNRCKSDIKFLDYCALCAAGLYSRAPAYAASVEHGVTGMLVENTAGAWEVALEALLHDPRLRKRLAKRACEYLYRERVLATQAPAYADLLSQVLSQ